MTDGNDSQKTATPDPPPPRRRRRVWLMVLLSVVILLSGMAIGSGLTMLWIQRLVLRRFRHPERLPAEVTARLRRKLNLTDEQAKRVEEILRKRQEHMREIFREIGPRIRAERDSIRAEVAEVLTPEQAEKWNQYYEDMRRRWTIEGRTRPGPPPLGKRPRR